MEIAYTLLLMAVLAAAMLVLRLRWPRLHRPARTRWLTALLLCGTPLALSLVSGYETTSEFLNTLLLWDRVLLYLALVLFFTLLRPRWLTALIAVVLLLPLASASALGRLAGLFSTAPSRVQHVGDFLLETTPWTSGEDENSGVDFALARQPAWLHGLRHGLHGGRLYNSQCQTAAASLIVDAPHHLLHLHCPPLPSLDGPSGTDLSFSMR